MSDVKDYVTYCPKCGGIDCAVSSRDAAFAAREVAKLIGAGLSVRRMTTERVRAGRWCECYQAPAQPNLFEETGDE